MIKFSGIPKEESSATKQPSKKDSKLTFSELSRHSDHPANSAVPATGPVHIDSGKDRKILYENASIYLNQMLNAVRNQEEIALGPGLKIMKQIVEFDHPQDQIFLMAIHLDDRFKFVIHHSINVAIYAIKLADNLKFRTADKIEIGMVGLLHDIGMAVIPDEIITKQDELTEREFNIIRERPNHSYRILESLGQEFGYLAECAIQVYERIDGSGYPRGLKGDEIHEYAQLIGLVDMYEALIHSRPHRKKFTHFMAIKEIINTCKQRFKRKHLKSLLNTFTIFPIHSYVRLNSDAIGKVVETFPEQPMRPKIQIIFDSQKKRILAERIVSLPENPLLYIVDSVGEEEIKKLSQGEHTNLRSHE